MSRALGVVALSMCLLCACHTCPPGWADGVGTEDGRAWAAASAGEVFVDADATRLALTRAARRLAEHLGLDVQTRLSVLLADEQLFVEAVGTAGPIDGLDGLELMALLQCDGRTYARVGLPTPER